MSMTEPRARPKSGSRPKVYIASPLGFAASTLGYYKRELLPSLMKAGYVPLDPWQDPDGQIANAFAEAEAKGSREQATNALETVDMSMGLRNARLIEEADAVLAVLDGPDVDSGTASEIGFASAHGKPIVGLRTDTRRTGENGGVVVNLQVEYFIRSTGGRVVRQLEQAMAVLQQVLHR